VGIAAYVAQLLANSLMAPWYMPITATLGAILVGVALWKARSIWRILALVLVMLFAGAEWSFLLLTRLPPYAGPVIVGKPFPVFATMRADDTPFTQQDLPGGQDNVMVFFRGRW
jgi:hypothetical protein